MADEKTTQAYVTETGESVFAVRIDVSGHELIGDEPEEAGGKDLGPSPYDLLTASLGECTAMTVRWYARRQNWPLEKVEVKVSYQKQQRTDTFTKKVTLHGPQLSDEQRAKLIDVAGKCPVQRTLEGAPQIRTENDE